MSKHFSKPNTQKKADTLTAIYLQSVIDGLRVVLSIQTEDPAKRPKTRSKRKPVPYSTILGVVVMTKQGEVIAQDFMVALREVGEVLTKEHMIDFQNAVVARAMVEVQNFFNNINPSDLPFYYKPYPEGLQRMKPMVEMPSSRTGDFYWKG